MKKLLCSLCLTAVCCMVAGPALAATEWNFAASLRFATFWTENDVGKNKVSKGGGIADIEGGGKRLNSDGTLEFLQQRNSRIKMLMKSDNTTGYIELGYNVATGAVTCRDFFGTYHFTNDFSMTIGQHLQLFDTPGLSSQVWGNDLNMHGIGVSWNPSDPKIFFTYKDFQFGLSTPYHTEGKFSSSVTGASYSADKDTFMPQLQFAYRHKGESWRMMIGGGFQTYKMKDLTDGGGNVLHKSKNINSWLVTADTSINFGPLYLAGSASVGQNWTEACWNSRKGGLGNEYANNKRMDTFSVNVNPKNNKLENTSSAMGAVIVGYHLTEALRLEAGFGYRWDENDAWDKDSHMWTTYLQAAYTVTPGFRIIPEIGYVDLGKTVGLSNRKGSAIDDGYIWYAGAKWQMDF